MTRHERVYRGLLSVYPASFRARYEDEMATLFADQLRDARASGHGAQTVQLWLRSLGDIVSTAPGQHFRREELVPRPIDADAIAGLDEPPRGALGRTGYALALLPLWAWIFLNLFAMGFMEPVFANPPSVVGIPLGAILIVVAWLVMALGLVAMRRTRSAAGRMAAFALLTIPALILTVLAPVIVLAVVNTGPIPAA